MHSIQVVSDYLSNLKALCFRTNTDKRDTDTSDFRGLQASHALSKGSCVFCALERSGRVLLENDLALCIAYADPVTPGDGKKYPQRHVADDWAPSKTIWSPGGCC